MAVKNNKISFYHNDNPIKLLTNIPLLNDEYRFVVALSGNNTKISIV